jgi:uncharacterized protein (TIGR02246 family)
MSAAADHRPTVEDYGEHAEDTQAIEQVIADIEAGFNGNDPDLSVEHFIKNACVINAVGVRLSGWDALLEANRAGLAGPLRDEHARYRVDDIVFIRPDVALAYKQAWATNPSGELLDLDPAMVAIYVMVKQEDRWWIAARANTLVAK